MTIYKIILICIFLLKSGIDTGIKAQKYAKGQMSGNGLFGSVLALLLIYGTLLFLIVNA